MNKVFYSIRRLFYPRIQYAFELTPGAPVLVGRLLGFTAVPDTFKINKGGEYTVTHVSYVAIVEPEQKIIQPNGKKERGIIFIPSTQIASL